MAVTIITPNPPLNWNGTLETRTSTTHLVIHHAAGTGSVYDIHNQHLLNGWVGIGYNFYIRQDGTIYEGRGWDKVGAHEPAVNYVSIGICLEGDYQVTQTVPVVQQRACIALMGEAFMRYPTISNIGGHNDFAATLCPGQYFPKSIIFPNALLYNGVANAANILTSKGVINSPNYWIDNFFLVQNLGSLLLVCAQKCHPYITYYAPTVLDALIRLMQQDIISDINYWFNVYPALPYLGEFLINAANRS